MNFFFCFRQNYLHPYFKFSDFNQSIMAYLNILTLRFPKWGVKSRCQYSSENNLKLNGWIWFLKYCYCCQARLLLTSLNNLGEKIKGMHNYEIVSVLWILWEIKHNINYIFFSKLNIFSLNWSGVCSCFYYCFLSKSSVIKVRSQKLRE